MQVTEWEFSMEIPNFEKVHNVLHAFLRTSEHGEWVQDDSEKADPFVLYYRRGLWKKSFFGFGGRLVPLDYRDARQAPVRLTLTLRPSPQDVSISVRYRFCTNWTISKKMEQAIANNVASEVRGLASYLKKFYELPALPDVRTS
jgi:hypothetical protein